MPATLFRLLRSFTCVAIVATAGLKPVLGAEETVVLRGTAAQVSIATAGGGIVEFRLADQQLNPLNWEISDDLEPRVPGQPFLRGHFLCLDRWGAPSDAEAARGVPYHGEAPRIAWQVTEAPKLTSGTVTAAMRCTLPLAGMQVARKVRLLDSAACLVVAESVTNTAKLGRIYNMVQHPSIAPPFLDESTVVDTNAREGFVQEGPIPESRDAASSWPEMNIGGQITDLRRYRNDPGGSTDHDVSSFVFDPADEYGWVTACNPGAGLMVGYLWKTQEYPWLNLWRYRYQGDVAARGLEFGTTGYHQPFGALVRIGRILDRPLFAYLDAGETVDRTYAAFLFKVPADYRGVGNVVYENGMLSVVERGAASARPLCMEVGDLFGD